MTYSDLPTSVVQEYIVPNLTLSSDRVALFLADLKLLPCYNPQTELGKMHSVKTLAEKSVKLRFGEFTNMDDPSIQIITASYANDHKALAELLKGRGNPTALDNTAIKDACRKSSVECLCMLLNDGRVYPVKECLDVAISNSRYLNDSNVLAILIDDGRVLNENEPNFNSLLLNVSEDSIFRCHVPVSVFEKLLAIPKIAMTVHAQNFKVIGNMALSGNKTALDVLFKIEGVREGVDSIPKTYKEKYLYDAIRSGSQETVEFMLENGFQKELILDDNTGYIYSCMMYTKLFSYLFNIGVLKINMYSLRFAIADNATDIIQVIIDDPVFEISEDPLLYSFRNEQKECVRLFITDERFKSYITVDCLLHTVIMGWTDIFELVMVFDQSHCLVHDKKVSNDSDDDIFSTLCYYNIDKKFETLRDDWMEWMDMSKILLFVAIEYEHIEVVILLLQHPQIRMHAYDDRVMEFARNKNNTEIIDVLFKSHMTRDRRFKQTLLSFEVS